MLKNKIISIILVEPSSILAEGLTAIIQKFSQQYQLNKTDSLDNVEMLYAKTHAKLLIINPSCIQNNTKTFTTLKNTLPEVKCLGLVHAYYEAKLLERFDDTITISDSAEAIISKIDKLTTSDNQADTANSSEILSEREIDVLKLLALGKANKEIAEKLNISIHTVISHRKNITQKTGIKSVSGLTIYAVVQKIITTESIQL